ncbi:MAG: FtsX-like permease family protein, partial [Candidatus Bathyarchaeia archaeon]
MTETAFPISDLRRRKLHTSLTFASLTACVAATLFLLLFSDQVSFMIRSSSQRALTAGLLTTFNQFLFFMGILVFAVGAIMVAFIVFLFLKQRTRDFGLIRATGCPTGLIFGYFFTELLIITFAACIFGTALGIAADYVLINLSSFQSVLKQPNFWYIPLVFMSFFVFALVFGAKPLFDTSHSAPVELLSETRQFGLTAVNKFKVLPKRRLTVNLATINLFRCQSTTLRVVVCLSIVFTLLTVSIAGSVIAHDTTTSWVTNAAGKDVFMIAHRDLSQQYLTLIGRFSGLTRQQENFNFLDTKFAINAALLEALTSLPYVTVVDPRLVTLGVVKEVSSYTFDPQTLATMQVGDHRQNEALIVGVDPQRVSANWRVDGRFLGNNVAFEAVVGDSIAQSMYSPNSTAKVERADPLSEGVLVQDTAFDIVGVCIDPVNNGFVVYVPLERLSSLTGFPSPNILFVAVDPTVDTSRAFSDMEEALSKVNADPTIVNLNDAVQGNVDFLGSLWTVVIFIPLFCLAAAVFGLVAFWLLSMEEQRKDYAVLRAVGVKPRQLMCLLGFQSLILLLSSFIVGLSLGTIITLFILMQKPVVSIFTP